MRSAGRHTRLSLISVISTITVRIKVARSELMPSTPTLAKIAVRAANTADRKAQSCQEETDIGLTEATLRRNDDE